VSENTQLTRACTEGEVEFGVLQPESHKHSSQVSTACVILVACGWVCRVCSVDDTLMCSFQILKPAEKKQKYLYGGGLGK
jgi:hypothetical protein